MFQESRASASLDPALVFFVDEAWFTLKGNVNNQNNRYWRLENPYLVHEGVFSYGIKVAVWCAVNAHKIVLSIFFLSNNEFPQIQSVNSYTIL